MSSNDNLLELIELKKSLRDYLKETREKVDEQLEHIQLVLDLFIAENLGNKFETFTYITIDVVNYLLEKPKWDLTEVEIASRVIGHSVNSLVLENLYEKLKVEVEGLEEKVRDNYLVNASMNILMWLFKKRNPGPGYPNNLELFEESLQKHLAEVNRICDKHGYHRYKAWALVREGMMYRDVAKMKTGISKLKDLDRHERANLLIREIRDILEINIEEE